MAYWFKLEPGAGGRVSILQLFSRASHGVRSSGFG